MEERYFIFQYRGEITWNNASFNDNFKNLVRRIAYATTLLDMNSPQDVEFMGLLKNVVEATLFNGGTRTFECHNQSINITNSLCSLITEYFAKKQISNQNQGVSSGTEGIIKENIKRLLACAKSTIIPFDVYKNKKLPGINNGREYNAQEAELNNAYEFVTHNIFGMGTAVSATTDYMVESVGVVGFEKVYLSDFADIVSSEFSPKGLLSRDIAKNFKNTFYGPDGVYWDYFYQYAKDRKLSCLEFKKFSLENSSLDFVDRIRIFVSKANEKYESTDFSLYENDACRNRGLSKDQIRTKILDLELWAKGEKKLTLIELYEYVEHISTVIFDEDENETDEYYITNIFTVTFKELRFDKEPSEINKDFIYNQLLLMYMYDHEFIS